MAQLVAQIICTDKVAGSTPACGSSVTNKKEKEYGNNRKSKKSKCWRLD